MSVEHNVKLSLQSDMAEAKSAMLQSETNVDYYKVLLEYMRTVRRLTGRTYISRVEGLTPAEFALLDGLDMAVALENDDARTC